MTGLKGEAGASPALSRNCNACVRTSEVRSPAPVNLLAPRGLGAVADGRLILAAGVVISGMSFLEGFAAPKRCRLGFLCFAPVLSRKERE